MAFTPAQLTTLKTFANANQEAAGYITAGNDSALTAWFNTLSAYVAWRTDVSRADIYHRTSPDATTWNWTTYKNQGVAEQNAWVQMFMGDIANFALLNLRAGVSAIFTGSAQANAQRDHCLAMGKRVCRRVEQALAVGTGTSADPGTMSFEGAISTDDAAAIRTA